MNETKHRRQCQQEIISETRDLSQSLFRLTYLGGHSVITLSQNDQKLDPLLSYLHLLDLALVAVWHGQQKRKPEQNSNERENQSYTCNNSPKNSAKSPIL